MQTFIVERMENDSRVQEQPCSGARYSEQDGCYLIDLDMAGLLALVRAHPPAMIEVGDGGYPLLQLSHDCYAY